MKGFSARVKTGTGPDKTAELELENGEVIRVFDGKKRLADADGTWQRVKCVCVADSITVETEKENIEDSPGIRGLGGNSTEVLVVGEVTDEDARRRWADSPGIGLAEVGTGMGQIAVKQDVAPTNDYRMGKNHRVKVFCKRLTILDVQRE